MSELERKKSGSKSKRQNDQNQIDRECSFFRFALIKSLEYNNCKRFENDDDDDVERI